MATNPITQSALDQLQEAEFVTEFQEGSNRSKMLTPADMLQLRELENKLASDEARNNSTVYKLLD
jgi:hypothetical protein